MDEQPTTLHRSWKDLPLKPIGPTRRQYVLLVLLGSNLWG